MNKVSELILKHVAGNVPVEYSEFTQEQREDAVRSVFLKEIGIEGAYSAKAFRKAFNKNKETVYEIIEEIALDGVKGLERHPFFNTFVEIRNLDMGQTNSFIVKGRNSVIVSEAAANWSMKRQRVESGQSFTVLPNVYNVSVYEMCDRLAAGQSTFSDFINEVRDAITSKLEEICHTALSASLKNLPAQFVANGSYDENAIMDVIEHVEAINGEPAVLVGTKSAIARLQNKTLVGLSDAQKDEKAKYGYIKEWNGNLCIPVENIAKAGTFDLLLPNDEILVLSHADRPIRLVLEGGEINRELSGTDSQDNSLTLSVMFRAGVAVCHAKVLGKVTIAG